jgi:ubiquinone/menaquinone biosynthesis C-methylase UbiE
MSNLEFDDEVARTQEAISNTAVFVAQRRQTIQTLGIKPGERILDIGTGTGHLAFDIAVETGGANEFVGLDISEDMLAIARERCVDYPAIKFEIGSVYDLPFPNESFDAVISVQVFEYLDDIPKALAEACRVLKSDGRLLIRDTDWRTLLWHAGDSMRMERILAAWDLHLEDPHLPQTLSLQLKEAGFEVRQVEPFVTLETQINESCSSFYIVKFIEPYVVGQGIEQSEADEWVADLYQQAKNGSYFYSLNSYVFVAFKKA